jgi:hypothetical protein
MTPWRCSIWIACALAVGALPRARAATVASPGAARELFDRYLAGDAAVSPGDARAMYERYLLEGQAASRRRESVKWAGFVRVHHRYEGTVCRVSVESGPGVGAFGITLTYPTDRLVLSSVLAGADTEGWVAADGVERAIGVVVAGGFDAGVSPAEETVELLQLTFEVTAPPRGRGVVVDTLLDDVAGATVEYTGIPRVAMTAPTVAIEQHHPGSRETTFRYHVPCSVGDRRRVRLALYNDAGVLTRVLVDGVRESGPHAVRWDGTTRGGEAAAPGVYICRLQTGARGEVVAGRRVVIR